MKKLKSVFVVFSVIVLVFLCACIADRVNEPPDTMPATTSFPDHQVSSPDDQATTHAAPEDDLSSLEQAENQPEPGEESAQYSPALATGQVDISFDFTRQTGAASNQYAVWIEDTAGSLVKTLYASAWTANGGYRTRPDSIALWAEKSGLANMSGSEVDAVSGATPRTGRQSYTWDMTDTEGSVVASGVYTIFVEGTLRWKNYVIYSATVEIGQASATIPTSARFHYEAEGRYGALNANSSENNMIGAVTISFTP